MKSVIWWVALVAGCAPSSQQLGFSAPEPAVFSGARLSLDASTGAGDLRVYPSETDDIVIRPLLGEGGWSWEDDGSTVTIVSLCANGVVGCDTGFIFEVPVGQVLTLATVSGDVELGSGFEGDVTVEMRTGALWSTGLGTTTVEVTTESGAVTLGFWNRPGGIGASTFTGAIDVEVPAGAYDFAIDTAGALTIDGIALGDGPPVLLDSTAGAIALIGT